MPSPVKCPSCGEDVGEESDHLAHHCVATASSEDPPPAKRRALTVRDAAEAPASSDQADQTAPENKPKTSEPESPPETTPVTPGRAKALLRQAVIRRKLAAALWEKKTAKRKSPVFTLAAALGDRPSPDFPADLAGQRAGLSREDQERLSAYLRRRFPKGAPRLRLAAEHKLGKWSAELAARLLGAAECQSLRSLQLGYLDGSFASWPGMFKARPGQKPLLVHLGLKGSHAQLKHGLAMVPPSLRSLSFGLTGTGIKNQYAPAITDALGQLSGLRKLRLCTSRRGGQDKAQEAYSTWFKAAGRAGALETVVTDFVTIQPSDFPQLRRLSLPVNTKERYGDFRMLPSLSGLSHLRTLSIRGLSHGGCGDHFFAPLQGLASLRCLRLLYQPERDQDFPDFGYCKSFAKLPLHSLQIHIQSHELMYAMTKDLRIHAPASLRSLELRLEYHGCGRRGRYRGRGYMGKPVEELAYHCRFTNSSPDLTKHRGKGTKYTDTVFMRLDKVELEVSEKGLLAGESYPELSRLSLAGPASLINVVRPEQVPSVEWVSWEGSVGTWAVLRSLAFARPADPLQDAQRHIADLRRKETAAMERHASRRAAAAAELGHRAAEAEGRAAAEDAFDEFRRALL